MLRREVSFFVFFFSIAACALASVSNVSFEELHQDRHAIYLLDEMSIEVHEDWSYTTKVHTRIKILKEEARSFGDMPISYDAGTQSVSDIQAFTVTSGGHKHEYTKIQDLHPYSDYPMYSHATRKIITFPQVGVGSVLDIQYTMITKTLPMKNAFWYVMGFLPSFPTQSLKFSIKIPKKLGVRYKEYGLSYLPKVSEDEKTVTYDWDIQNLEDEEDEREDFVPFPTPESFKELVEFSSIPGWQEVSEWYADLVHENFILIPDIQKTAERITADQKTIRDKVKAILEYTQQNFRYVSMSFGEHSMEPHPTDEVFKNRYGDCKDLSLLAMAMLQSVGVESHIALFAEESSSSDPQYDLPLPSLFNHVLLLVRDPVGGDFYADPLLMGYDVGEYPVGYQGAYTFIITKEGGNFSRLPIFDLKRNSESQMHMIYLEPDGAAVIETEKVLSLDTSIDIRRRVNAMDKSQRKKMSKVLEERFTESGAEKLDFQLDGLEKKYGPIKVRYKMKEKELYPVIEGLLVIPFDGYNKIFKSKNPERKEALFYPTNAVQENIQIIHIPDGFAVTHIPENFNIPLGLMEIRREFLKEGWVVTVKETWLMRRTKIPKEEYGKFYEISETIPSVSAQRIVLKKMP